MDNRVHVSGITALDVSISPEQTDRAMRLLDTLIKASESRGMRWAVGEKGTTVECDGEQIRVRLHETLSKQPTEPPPPRKANARQPDYGSLRYPRYEWVSKGRLGFMVEDHVANGARRVWASTANVPLDLKLHEILAGLPIVAAGIRLHREEREAWRRQYEVEKERKKEIARNVEIERRRRVRLVHSLEQGKGPVDSTTSATLLPEKSPGSAPKTANRLRSGSLGHERKRICSVHWAIAC